MKISKIKPLLVSLLFLFWAIEANRASPGFSDQSSRFLASEPDSADNVFGFHENEQLRTESAVVLEWVQPAHWSTTDPAMYNVLMQSESNNRLFQWLTETSLKVEGIHIGTKYTFTISSANTEPDQATVSVWFIGEPENPTELKEIIEERGPQTVVLEWKPPIDFGGDESVTYRVFQSTGGSQFRLVATDITETRTVIDKMYANTHYEFKVVAANSFMESQDSVKVRVWFLRKPDPPTDLFEIDRSEETLTLGFSKPVYLGGDSKVSYACSVNGQQPGQPVSDLQCTIGGLILGLNYTVTVQAINSYSFGDASEPLTFEFLAKPSPPTALKEVIDMRTNQSLVLVWDAPEVKGGSDDLFYNVFMQIDGGKLRTVQIEHKERQLIIEFLVPQTEYTFQVSVRNDYTESDLSEPFTVDFKWVPSVPGNLTEVYLERTPTSIMFEWSAPEYADQWSSIKLSVNGSCGQQAQQACPYTHLVERVDANYTVLNSDLVMGTIYLAQVRHVNSFSPSPWSDPLPVIFFSEPAKPQNISEAERTLDSLTLKWQAPENTGGDPGTLTYNVRLTQLLRGGQRTKVRQEINESPATQFVARELEVGRAYTVEVQTVNAYTASEMATYEFIFLQEPGAPTGLEEDFRGRTDSSMLLVWQEPEFKGGQMNVNYTLEQRIDSEWLPVQQHLQGTNATLTDLLPGQTYEFRVRTDNNFTQSAPSALFKTTFTVKKEAMFNLTEVSRTDSSVRVEWNTPPLLGDSLIKYYQVSLLNLNQTNATYQPVARDWRRTKINISGLQLSIFYRFKVEAFDQFGRTVQSVPLEVQLLEAPSAPLRLGEDVAQRSEYSMLLTWEEPENYGGAGTVDYLIGVLDTFGQERMYETERKMLRITDLFVSETYVIRVKAMNSYTSSEWSEPLELLFLKAPGAPQNIREEMSLRSSESVLVRWDPPDDFGGAIDVKYNIYVQHSPKDEITLLQANSTYLQVRVPGLTAGQFFTVLIKTQNDYRESNSSLFTTLFTSRPSEPVNLREDMDKRTNTSLELVWDTPLRTGGSPTLNYTVVLFDSILEQVTVLEENVQSNSAVISGLKIGSTYEFRVRAVYLELESAFSLGYTVSLVGKPNKPTGVAEVALQRGSNSVLLEWMAPEWTGLVNGGNISYIVQVWRNDQLEKEVKSAETQVRVGGLENDNYYSFQVLTYNQVALSDASDTLEIHFLSKPFAPSSLTEDFTQRTNSSALLTWTQPQNMDGFESYTVFWIVNDKFEVFLSGLTEPSCLVESLVPGQELAFKVRAENSQQNDTNGEVYELTFLVQPEAPVDVRVVSRSAEEVHIQWDAPYDMGGATSLLYDLFVGEQEFIDWNETSVNVTGLEVGDVYRIRVIAKNQDYSSEEASIEFTYLITPSVPLNLHEVTNSRTNDSLELEWNPPLENGGGNLTYTVYMTYCSFKNEPVIMLLSSLETTENSLIWPGLRIGLCYRFDITARNDFAESEPSEGLTLQFMSKPSAPVYLMENLEKRTATSLTVDWGEPQDIGGALQITYLVTLSLNGTELHTIETDEFEATFTGLIATNTYTVQVVADNGYLPSEPSETIDILLLGEPTVPSDLAIEFNGANLDLTWSIESDGGFPITNMTLLAQTPLEKWAIITPMCEFDEMLQNNTCSLPLFKLKTWPLSLTYRDDLCVKIRATNEWGDSDFTEPVCFSKVILQEPNPPQNLTEMRRNRTETQLGLKWDPPVWRGGSPTIDLEYVVVVLTDPKRNRYDLVSAGINTTEYVVTNLTAGETYTFAVLSRNAIGDSALSDPVTLWCSWVPSQPLNITANRTEIQTRVNISWTTPEFDNASPIKDYRVSVVNPKFNQSIDVTERCLYEQMLMNRQQCIIEMRFFTDSYAPQINKGFKMTDEDPFCVQVQALNSWGPSEEVTPLCFPGVIMIEPSAPSNLEEVLSLRNENTLGLRWSRPPTGGADHIWYSLWLKKENGLLLVRRNITREQTSLSGFEIGRNYTFVVKAHNAMGVSALSEPLTLTCAWISQPPQLIEIANGKENSVVVEWNKVRNMGSKITNSSLYINDADGNLVDASASCVWTENYRICQLSQRVLYYPPFNMTKPKERLCVRVTVTNQYGVSELSDEVCEMVIISQKPTPPSDLKNRDSITNAQRLGVEWSESFSHNPILAYLIYSDLGGTEWQLLDGELSEPRFKSHQCSGLYPYPDVVIGVRSTALNFIGESSPSETFYLTMSEEQSDRKLEITSVGRKTVNVSWEHLISFSEAKTFDVVVIQGQESQVWKGLAGVSKDVQVGYGNAEVRVYGMFNAVKGCSCEEPPAGELVELAISVPTAFVVPFEIPETPFNITTQFHANDSIKVNWQAGDDGGLAQLFEIQARNSTETQFTTIGVTNETHFVYRPQNVSETFTFRVRAANDEGSSEFSEPVQKEQVNQIAFNSGTAQGFYTEENEEQSRFVGIVLAASLILILAGSLLCAKVMKQRWRIEPIPMEGPRQDPNASQRRLRQVEMGTTLEEQI